MQLSVSMTFLTLTGSKSGIKCKAEAKAPKLIDYMNALKKYQAKYQAELEEARKKHKKELNELANVNLTQTEQFQKEFGHFQEQLSDFDRTLARKVKEKEEELETQTKSMQASFEAQLREEKAEHARSQATKAA